MSTFALHCIAWFAFSACLSQMSSVTHTGTEGHSVLIVSWQLTDIPRADMSLLNNFGLLSIIALVGVSGSDVEVCDVGIDISRLVFHLISTVFLLLTLVLYLIEPVLRSVSWRGSNPAPVWLCYYTTIQQRNFRRRYLYSRFNMALLANMLVGFLLVIINTVFDVQKISIKETVGKYI